MFVVELNLWTISQADLELRKCQESTTEKFNEVVFVDGWANRRHLLNSRASFLLLKVELRLADKRTRSQPFSTSLASLRHLNILD